MRFLGLGDYAVILAYFVILIGIGAYFRKKAAESMEDYFLAGRKMPWWALGLSQMTFWFMMMLFYLGKTVIQGWGWERIPGFSAPAATATAAVSASWPAGPLCSAGP